MQRKAFFITKPKSGGKKILTALMCFAISCMTVNTVGAQTTASKQIDLTLTNATVKEMFQAIEKASDFRFLFDANDVDINVKINAKYSNTSIDRILKEKLPDCIYEIKGNQIVIKPRQKLQQTMPVKGTVFDALTHEPLAGVTILEKGSATNGTATDENGVFAFTVSDNAILQISYIGYKTQEIIFSNDGKPLIINLAEDSQALEEVVIVGYGTQKKVNVTGAITVADVTKLNNRPITTTSQALQGLNGLYVNQTTGQPGNDGATIRIRGVGTLNNNDPLVLVDGISYPLMDINPNEIESISVLKDAASTAVYGSRAANGVIIIKTKSGKRKEKYSISYNNYFGVEQVSKLPDVEWDPIKFMEYKNIALSNEGKAKEYTDAEIEEYRNGMAGDPNGYMYPRTNTFDIALQNGFMHEHNITVAGGSDKSNMALTLGVLSQEGILKYDASKASRFSMGLNGKMDLTEFLSVGAKISGVFRKYNEPQMTMNSYWEQAIFRTPPIYPVLIADGRYGNTWLRSTGLNTWANTLSRLKEGERNHVRQRLLGNVFADLKLPFNIHYHVNMAANTYDYIQHVFQPYLENVNPKTFAIVYASNITRGYRRYEKELNLTAFHTVDWNMTFANKHTVSLLLGNSFENFSGEYFSAQKDQSMDNELTDMDVFLVNPTVAGNSTKSAILSYFGRLNYNFDEKYLIEANFRYDGSSRFARGHRWGLFPSFSLGWRMDRESFLSDIECVSGLKPRLSWGKIGNQEITLWSYVNSITLNQNYSFGTTEAIGAAATAASDPDLSWETTTMTNFGIDFAFFKNKLTGSLELYNKDTDGILRAVNYAHQVGNLTGPTTNVGSMNNKGFELLFNYRDITHNRFSYEAGGSFAWNKNKVTNLNGQDIISGRYITTEGHPVNSYYIYEAEPGFFLSQEEINAHAFQNAATKVGFIKYKDQNDDKVINTKDRKIVHGVVPEFTYSFNLGVGYKDFDLMAFFQGVGKVYTYTASNISYPYYNGAGVQKEWETDAWTPENPNSRLPILTTSTGNTLNFENSTFWLQNASYMRLKNLQLTYTVPRQITGKLRMQAFKIFVNGQNLLTFTKMKNWDPEKNLTQDNIYAYPTIKIYSAGINVTF